MLGEAGIRLVEAEGSGLLEHARKLFRCYATEFAGSIAESLCFQGFEAKLTVLPGRYGQPGGLLLLAMIDDNPEGCVALRGLDETTFEMKRLYVIPEYRYIDLGKRLVEELVRRAARLGYSRVVLDTLPEMVQAIGLYRFLGFQDTDRYWDNPIERTIYLERLIGAVDQLNGNEPKL
jgi:ribosomal protein S18 acetylase RimI-like enzyme